MSSQKVFRDLERRVADIEKEISDFATDVSNRLDNRETDFIPQAIMAVGMSKMKLLSILQEVENLKSAVIFQLDTAIRASGIKTTEAKISKTIDADTFYQEILLLISKVKGLIDILKHSSIALTTASRIWATTDTGEVS